LQDILIEDGKKKNRPWIGNVTKMHKNNVASGIKVIDFLDKEDYDNDIR